MKLEAQGQHAIIDPHDSQIESAVSLLSLPDRSFVIVSRSRTSYIQAAIAGLLLMLDAIFAIKRAVRDSLFGLEGMDAFAIAFVMAMAASIIDLRRFGSVSRMENAWAIDIIAVGLVVVAIQMIEHLTAR